MKLRLYRMSVSGAEFVNSILRNECLHGHKKLGRIQPRFVDKKTAR